MTKNLGLALEKINFKKKNERIEFKSDLVNLPNDTGTPLLWKALETDGIDLEFAGGIMDLCTVGDPNSDPAEKAIHFLKTDLIDPDYQSKPEAIQIGYLNEKPVAFVFAQVDPTSRWSRITYMGLIPEMRKKGLGKWVHRHGFEMMRQQGGKQYFGGTTTDNQLMLATFRAHGCEEYKILEEWIFTP